MQKFSIESEKSNQLIAELIKQTGQAREKRPNTTVDELTTCQNLAIDCGAAEDYVEYFVATQLFVEKANRVMFMNMKSKEARFMWLRRYCVLKNLT